ncbi:MAG: transketolase subunit [Rhodospirillales bacterium]|nr:transketolase subunit [Rhodospirillales bacterium]
MRNAFSDTLYACALEDPSIYIVVADISPAGSMAKLRVDYPERFINVGVAEQVMIGIAAGLALKGAQPFAYTIATFSLYRPFEMVRDDLCYQNLPVTVVGMGSGLVYSTLGGTHHTMEDVAIATALPNMQVIAPCDPLEVVEATRYCARQKVGPVYLKLGKAGEAKVTENAVDPFVFGKIRYLQKGTDTAILTYGPMISQALEVAKRLEARGETVSVVSVHTLKPLDVPGIAAALAGHARVIVMEENVPHGALASRVKEIAWDTKVACDLRVFTLKDEFIHFYGSYEQLLEQHGISVEQVLNGLD